MANLIFADSSGLIAYWCAGEERHERAVRAVREALRSGRRFLTTNYVFDEVVTRVRRRAGFAASRRAGEGLLRSRVITRITIDEDLEAFAWRLYERYQDHDFSFTDVTSFAVMRRAGIAEAFTFDEDFARAGFVAFPGRA